MKSAIIFFVFLSFSFLQPADQKECGTDHYFSMEEYTRNLIEYQQAIDENFQFNSREIMWIPVAFHIVRNDNGSGGLPIERIDIGLDDLNTLLGESGFRFYQLGEIDFINNSNYYSDIDSYDEINDLRQINQVVNTLNIYSTAVLNNGNYDLCGISTFSWYNSGSQGVVMANSCFATSDNHSTLAHEVGHYFNLYHTHQGSSDSNGDGIIDGENAEFVDGTDCELLGDGLCDTVADPVLSDVVSGSCLYTGNYIDGHGDQYDPDTSNLMSYSVKNCRDFTSPEQFNLMTFTYETDRPWLNVAPSEPNIVMSGYTINESDGDGDNVFNPGEFIELTVMIENHPDWPDAGDVELFLFSSNEAINLIDDYFWFPELISGESSDNSASPFTIEIDDNAELTDYELSLVIFATGENDAIFNRSYTLNLQISLHQQHWPVRTLSDSLNQVQGVPLVYDLDGDAFPEFIFADYNGIIYSVDRFGEMIDSDIFPFSADNSFWGDLASADIDNDGNIEIIAASKDKHLYIIDPVEDILQLDYNSNQFLISAPALGNIDDDSDFEIFFGGFSNSGMVFGINHDGSAVDGFPVQINAKIRGGIALADIDQNSRVDILTVTESNQIWLILDNGEIANGFPFQGGDKFKEAPAFITVNDQHMILAGCEDGLIYSLDTSGNLNFTYDTGAAISTGFGFIDLTDGPAIFFGNENGQLFAIDIMGNDLIGWPVDVNGIINSTPVFTDLNNDGIPEVISGTSIGDLLVFDIYGMTYPHFPFHYGYQFISSGTISDIDMDGDSEIIMGSTHSVVMMDIKEPGNSFGYWDTFQGNPQRTGHFVSSLNGECPNPMLGDLNCDGILDVLDIVRLVNIIIYPENDEPGIYELWAADLNEDSVTDILDAVILVNLIIN